MVIDRNLDIGMLGKGLWSCGGNLVNKHISASALGNQVLIVPGVMRMHEHPTSILYSKGKRGLYEFTMVDQNGDNSQSLVFVHNAFFEYMRDYLHVLGCHFTIGLPNKTVRRRGLAGAKCNVFKALWPVDMKRSAAAGEFLWDGTRKQEIKKTRVMI